MELISSGQGLKKIIIRKFSEMGEGETFIYFLSFLHVNIIKIAVFC